MGIIVVIISCGIPIIMAIISPLTFIYYILYTGALPFGMVFGEDILTPFGHLNVLSLRVLGVVFASSLVIIMNINKLLKHIHSVFLWVVFILWCGLTLLWSDNYIYGLRGYLKIIAPFFFSLAIMVIDINRIKLQQFAMAVVTNLFVLGFIAFISKYYGITGPRGALGVPSHGSAVFSAYLMIPIVLSFSYIIHGINVYKWSVIFLLSVILILLTSARTPLAASVIGIAIIFFVRLPLKISLPVVLILFVSLLTLIFQVDYFNKRMFYAHSNVSIINIIDNPDYVLKNLDFSGRLDLWKNIIKNVYKNPIIGSGVGSTQAYLYENAKMAKAAHSEYIKLLCDTGLIGLVLFISVGISILIKLKGMVGDVNKRNQIATASMSLIVAYYMFCITDNGLDYINALGIYVFAFIAVSFISRRDNIMGIAGNG